MNRRILGFQRRVWCPKCTPASSRCSSCGCVMRSLLALRELEPLAGPGAPGLLALHHARIAGQQALLAQLLAVPLVGQAQRPPDGEPQRPRLPRDPTAPNEGAYVERAQHVSRRERLLDV